MATYTPEEQKIYDHVAKSLPPWFFVDVRSEEFIQAVVRVFDLVRQNREALLSQVFILEATSDPPNYLALHASDRGTAPQEDEGDPELRDRLRTFADAVTRPAIAAAVQEMIDAAAVSGQVALVELRRDRGYYGTFISDAGTGGTFIDAGGGRFRFQPTVRFQEPLEIGHVRSGAQGDPLLVISGAASAGNDGSFVADAVAGDAVEFDNGSGVAGADATVSWILKKRDIEGNVRDGFRRAYYGRGYRYGDFDPPGAIVILPFGADAGLAASVAEKLRQTKAFGVICYVEVRGVAP